MVADDAKRQHDCPAKPEGLKLDDDFLGRVLNLLREKHPLISDMFCSGAGIDLQYTDSRITEHIIKHFAIDRVATGGIPVPVLSVHDSYIIAEEYKDELWEEMQIAWDKETSLKLDPNKVGYLQSLSPQNTRAIQHGYTDELIEDDPEEHQRLTALKEDEYVSPRYVDRFETFEKWRKKGKASM